MRAGFAWLKPTPARLPHLWHRVDFVLTDAAARNMSGRVTAVIMRSILPGFTPISLTRGLSKFRSQLWAVGFAALAALVI